MIRKISLIEPRSPRIHAFSGVPLPRLGLPLIGTILRDQGYDVKVYCEDIKRISSEDMSEIYQSNLVGISTTTSTVPRAYSTARILSRKKIPVVFGGVHATFMPEEVLQHGDYCVRGEAEETIVELVRALNGDGTFDQIKGLSYRLNGEIHHNETRRPIEDLDSLPSPDLSLIQGYSATVVAPIATSRGCPYDCSFCSVTSMFGRKYRFRSTEGVLEDLKKLKYEHVFFYDDNFTANPARTKELLNRMIEEGVTPRWSAQVRTDVAKDEEMLDLFQKSNCSTLYIGFESVNPETLELYDKKQTLDDIRKCVDVLHSRGIAVHGMFIFGADTDDLKTIDMTIRFAKQARLESVQFMALIPLPGTRTFQQMDEEGRILTKQWELYDGHSVVFDPTKMTPLALQKETAAAFRRFYSFWEIFKQMWTFDLLRIGRHFRGRKLASAQARWWRRREKSLREEQIQEIDTYPEKREGFLMIKRNEILVLLALMMIVVGLAFFLASLGVLTFSMSKLWPAFPLGLGVGLYGLFFFTWLGERKTQGLLPVATVLTILGLSFLYSAHVGWNTWRYIWPVAPLSLGMGFYSMYLWGRREHEVLGPAGVLTAVALLSFLGSTLRFDIGKLWPVILILLGLGLLLWNFNRRA